MAVAKKTTTPAKKPVATTTKKPLFNPTASLNIQPNPRNDLVATTNAVMNVAAALKPKAAVTPAPKKVATAPKPVAAAPKPVAAKPTPKPSVSAPKAAAVLPQATKAATASKATGSLLGSAAKKAATAGAAVAKAAVRPPAAPLSPGDAAKAAAMNGTYGISNTRPQAPQMPSFQAPEAQDDRGPVGDLSQPSRVNVQAPRDYRVTALDGFDPTPQNTLSYEPRGLSAAYQALLAQGNAAEGQRQNSFEDLFNLAQQRTDSSNALYDRPDKAEFTNPWDDQLGWFKGEYNQRKQGAADLFGQEQAKLNDLLGQATGSVQSDLGAQLARISAALGQGTAGINQAASTGSARLAEQAGLSATDRAKMAALIDANRTANQADIANALGGAKAGVDLNGADALGATRTQAAAGSALPPGLIEAIAAEAMQTAGANASSASNSASSAASSKLAAILSDFAGTFSNSYGNQQQNLNQLLDIGGKNVQGFLGGRNDALKNYFSANTDYAGGISKNNTDLTNAQIDIRDKQFRTNPYLIQGMEDTAKADINDNDLVYDAAKTNYTQTEKNRMDFADLLSQNDRFSLEQQGVDARFATEEGNKSTQFYDELAQKLGIANNEEAGRNTRNANDNATSIFNNNADNETSVFNNNTDNATSMANKEAQLAQDWEKLLVQQTGMDQRQAQSLAASMARTIVQQEGANFRSANSIAGAADRNAATIEGANARAAAKLPGGAAAKPLKGDQYLASVKMGPKESTFVSTIIGEAKKAVADKNSPAYARPVLQVAQDLARARGYLQDGTVLNKGVVNEKLSGYFVGAVPKAEAPSGGGSVSPSGNATVDRILRTIVGKESGGSNIPTSLRGPQGQKATAQGYYQFTNATWKSWAAKAGVSTSKYPTAMSAGRDIQDKVAATAVKSILANNGGKVEAIPATWYIGHYPTASEWDRVPMPQYGNTQTVRQYVNQWMSKYNKTK